MDKKSLYIIGIIVVLFAVGFGMGRVTAPIGNVPLEGMVHNTQETFDAGIAVQLVEVISDEREITAATSTVTGSFGVTGAATVSTTLGVTGATTLGSTLSAGGKISLSSASSTLQIGNTATGIAPGCIVIGDSTGATSTPVYITFSYVGGIAVATSTPVICE